MAEGDAAAMAQMGLPTGFDTTHGEAKPAAAVGDTPAGPVIHTAHVDDYHDGPGQKLAKFSSEAFPEMKWSTNKARGEVKAGLIRVNGQHAGANQTLLASDVVTVHKVAKAQWRNGMWSSTIVTAPGGPGGSQAAAVAPTGGSAEAFGVSLDASGKCNKRMLGINCGCPDCANLSAADKKKLKNRKKKEAKERQLAAAAAATAAAASTSAVAQAASVPASEPAQECTPAAPPPAQMAYAGDPTQPETLRLVKVAASAPVKEAPKVAWAKPGEQVFPPCSNMRVLFVLCVQLFRPVGSDSHVDGVGAARPRRALR